MCSPSFASTHPHHLRRMDSHSSGNEPSYSIDRAGRQDQDGVKNHRCHLQETPHNMLMDYCQPQQEGALEWVKGLNFLPGTGCEPQKQLACDHMGGSVAGPPAKVRDPSGGGGPWDAQNLRLRKCIQRFLVVGDCQEPASPVHAHTRTDAPPCRCLRTHRHPCMHRCLRTRRRPCMQDARARTDVHARRAPMHARKHVSACAHVPHQETESLQTPAQRRKRGATSRQCQPDM